METILFIEDDSALRENLSKILSLNNYYPLLAENGKLGIELANKMAPDLIICDVMLPDIDGYAILQELSKDKDTSFIPFIFLTAKIEMQDLRKGMDLGADDYLLKPLKTKEILNAIKLRLEKKKQLINQKLPEQSESNNTLNNEDAILISADEKVQSIKLGNIVCIISAGVYTYLYDNTGKKYLIRKILKEWQEILPEKNFLRIHRNSMINLNHIKMIEKCQNHTYRIFMKNYDKPLYTSHRFSSVIRNKLYN